MTFVKPFISFFILFLFLGMDVKAQISPAVNIQFRSNLTFPGQKCANIVGYAVNGREFALVGNQTGVGIVEVTNPVTPQLIVQIPWINNDWREIKVYQQYAYVTTEGTGTGQGLQIINLAKLSLPTPTIDLVNDVKVFKGPDGDLVSITRLHALHIDVAKGFLYGFGGISTVKVGGTNTNVDGAIVLDIKTDPWNPHYVGKYSGLYIHDGFVVNDTLYGGHIWGGVFSIIDFRNKTAPIVVATQATPNNFTHNTWRSDDGKYLFTTDERAASYIGSYDVSDPMNIKLLDKIRSPAEANAIVHNVHVFNDFLVTSWYTEGVTIVDAHRPNNLVQVGQYDTYNGAVADFKGAWGVYPYLPSGNLIVSNYTVGEGLFVLTPQYIRACYLEGLVTDKATGVALSGVAIKINTTDMDKKAVSSISGNYYTGQVTPGTVTVTYSKAGYISQTVTVTLVNGVVTLKDIQLMATPIPVELVEFSVKKTEKGVQLLWQTASETKTKSFDIERSRKESPQGFVKIGEVKAHGTGSTYFFDDDNLLSTTHYYRLKINPEYADGSPIDYTKTVSIVWEDKTSIKITPSVTGRFLNIETGESVEIFNILGELVHIQKLNYSIETLPLPILAAGTYLVRVRNGLVMSSKKIVISK
jgi:choice-of-anchor B domain-containing protein